MLQKTLNFYLITWIFLFIISIVNTENQFFEVNIFNFLVMFTYFTVLMMNLFVWKTYQAFNLLVLIALYSMLYIALINQLSYNYNWNYYVFTEKDALFYEQTAEKINYNLNNAKEVYELVNFDDWGAITISAIAYYFSDSNLMLNFFYWVFGLISAFYLFKLAKFFMSEKMAFLCSLSFFISSYILWFESTGLKETTIILLVVLAYYFLYSFKENNRVINLIKGVVFTLLLLFFRSVLPVFITVSFIIPILLQRKNNFTKILLVGLLVFISLAFSFVFEFINYRFNIFSRESSYLEYKQNTGAIKGGFVFTYLASVVSSLIGPFPTFSEKGSVTYQPLYSPGIYLKNLLSYWFLWGSWLIVYKKIHNLLPLLIFPLLEIAGLILLLESFELRKSIPHFPMLYLIIFWLMHEYNDGSLLKKSTKNKINWFLYPYLLLVMLMVLVWNFRF